MPPMMPEPPHSIHSWWVMTPMAEITSPPHQHNAATMPALRGPARSSQPPQIAADDPSTTKNSVYIQPRLEIRQSQPASALSGPWLVKNLPIWLAMWTSLSGDMGNPLLRDTTQMREDLEAVAAGDRHQRDVCRLRGPHGECGRRRHGDDDGNAEPGALLHHLDRDAAGQDDHSCTADDVVAGQRTGELVERIVASNVLAQCDEPGRGLPERRGMDRA